MTPRECDNDTCNYETGVVDGVAKSWWVHAEECDGPVECEPPRPEDVKPGSFLDFLMNGPR